MTITRAPGGGEALAKVEEVEKAVVRILVLNPGGRDKASCKAREGSAGGETGASARRGEPVCGPALADMARSIASRNERAENGLVQDAQLARGSV